MRAVGGTFIEKFAFSGLLWVIASWRCARIAPHVFLGFVFYTCFFEIYRRTFMTVSCRRNCRTIIFYIHVFA